MTASANYTLKRNVTDNTREGDLLEVSMGPHHPSTHGVFRMDVVLDGEEVVKLKPVFGYLMQDMGALGTPLMYAFREREKILDLFESLSGSRMMCNYMRFGGCRVDLPEGWLEQAKEIIARYPEFLDEFENLLSGNEIV